MTRILRYIVVLLLLVGSFGAGAGSRDELYDRIYGRAAVPTAGRATREVVEQAEQAAARAAREEEAVRQLQILRERAARNARQAELERMGIDEAEEINLFLPGN